MKTKKAIILLSVFTLLAVVCMIVADVIQTGFGTIDIQEGNIETEQGNMYYKLYVPKTATAETPAPGVLLLHGYQNDHETCAAYAIELARRGIVAMTVDEYGHGWTDIGLMNRGYVNHKVTVNYGEDNENDGTYVTISGAKRYRLMMNFSNLSFFNDHYSKDGNGNSIKDSSCGGIEAYAVLAKGFDFVDPKKLAVSGHSMGTWSSWSVAAAYSGTEIEPRATVLQCGELFTSDCYDSEKIHFNNVLLLQAKYDEFSYFRDYKPIVDDSLLKTPLRTEFLGTTASEAQWNKTYGSFLSGTARRIELLITNHRLTTHNARGLAVALDWFCTAFNWKTDLAFTSQVAMIKELLVLTAMLLSLAALLPLAELLLKTGLFRDIVQPMPTEIGMLPDKKRRLNSLITLLLAGASYPFMTQLGHGLLPLPEKVFRMTIGNGFVSYYGLLIIIMLILTAVSLKKEKKMHYGDRYFNIGLGTQRTPDRVGWGLMGRCAAMALCLVGYLYLLVFAFEKFLSLDLRFIWPFFKSFTGERLVQFLIYIPFYALFFVLNNSKAIAALRTKDTYEPGFKPFMRCWLRNALTMTGGVILIALVEYIPFFANIGPGADLLFGSTFGGPFMSLLILFLPQVLIFSVLATYLYRRTASVYTGAFVSAALACWIVTGGSSML